MLLQYARQHLPRNNKGGRREKDEGEGKTLISTQQLKADKQSRAQRKSTEPFCGPQLQSSKRRPFLTPFASKGAAPVFIQALSSAQRSERWSTKWWSTRGHVSGTFIFKCASLIQSTNSQRWVKRCVKIWWCAYNPLGLSDTEIKYCSIEMGGGGVVMLSVNLVWSRQRDNFRSFLCSITQEVVAANTTANYCTSHKPEVVILINNACLQSTLWGAL